jgi:hypothetical protein
VAAGAAGDDLPGLCAILLVAHGVEQVGKLIKDGDQGRDRCGRLRHEREGRAQARRKEGVDHLGLLCSGANDALLDANVCARLQALENHPFGAVL